MATLGVALLAIALHAQTPVFPAPLERYLESVVRPSAAERKALLAGEAVSKLLPSDAAKEVAVFGAVWIAGPPSVYISKVKDIENFERGGSFHITKRISMPPQLADFAAMRLPEEDFRDLRTCAVGDCEVKLDAPSLERFRTEVHWGTPSARAEADALFRHRVLDYLNGYLAGGNSRLPTYHDREAPIVVENELRTMLADAPALVPMPDLERYLLDYPAAPLSASSDFFYWQEVQFGLKTTIRINHLVIQDRPGAIVVASKMLYATHYFRSALELRVLLPDETRGRGFWFVTVSRSRLDGLTGFLGRIVRGRVRSGAQKGTMAILLSAKTNVEGPRR